MSLNLDIFGDKRQAKLAKRCRYQSLPTCIPCTSFLSSPPASDWSVSHSEKDCEKLAIIEISGRSGCFGDITPETVLPWPKISLISLERMSSRLLLTGQVPIVKLSISCQRVAKSHEENISKFLSGNSIRCDRYICRATLEDDQR